MPGAKVEIKRLTKRFAHGGRTIDVLRGIDLVIDPGERVAILGASGAGKSTLLQVVGTLDQPTTGSVAFDGEEVGKLSGGRLAAFRNRTIGFVFQFHHLLPDFTAEENCAMPALIAGESREAALQRSRKMLDRVGLSHRLSHRPAELSGGEQQRVALARALILQPRVLLADEPTGNLDVGTGGQIHALIDELNAELGMTMIVVTHNPAYAATLPRRVHMEDGRVVPEVPDEPTSAASASDVSPGAEGAPVA